MRSLSISALTALLLGTQIAAAQVAPFSMSPGQSAPSSQPDPAQPAAPSQPPAATFDMRGTAPSPQAPAPQPGANPAPAQSFDMRSGTPTQQGAAPQPPAQAAPPASATSPFQMAPQGRPPASAATPAPSPARPAVTSTAPARNAARIERPVMPFETIRLEGETDARAWTFHLSQDEAASGASLSLGYQNAVVVMPEASRLRISINGENVIDTPIASSDAVKRVTANVRPGLLRAGQNFIRMEALQRHRTDCTITATYELWTDVDSRSTMLTFAEGTTKTLRSLEDLPAIGVDATGVTTIRVVAPKVYRPEIRDRLLRLVQMIALRGRYARPVIQVVETDPGPSPVGTIKVVMGVASELRGLVPGIPDVAMQQPLTMMMPETGSGGSTLLVSGPSWADLDSAIAVIGSQAVNMANVQRGVIDTAAWHWPDITTAFGRRSFRFSDLGVPTQEFSGRRLKAQFALSLPSDFYATEYGEALLYVDAAYTSAVRPGSHIDIYVNDKISTQMTITAQGDIVRRHTIRLPLKNFKSGLNFVTVEVGLITDADNRCAPGETLSEANRFVLFDTSTFEFPDFGRIGLQPDLGVLSVGHFPNDDEVATTVVLARPDPLNVSAAGTFLARMARSAGAPVRAQFSNAASAEDESVLFVGAVEQIPQGLLSNVRVSEHLRMLWPSTPLQSERSGQQVANAEFTMPARPASSGPASSSTDEVRKRWAESFERRGIIQRTFGSLQDWVESTFSLSLSSLSLNRRADAPYEPPQRSTLLVAQNRTQNGGAWTLVTARSDQALAQEVARMADPILWSKVSGRAVALDPAEAKLQVEPIRDFAFVQTRPFSLLNLRLVAANWMSANILQYALLMLICCTVLGSSTYFLLKRLGRPS
ncbi:cellulose biosynthesis cyclic di-GMP-binding regulatory protein BcsB [Microvirga sp. 2YAF29]|uniref:cellulose biosynthesis cyclic di-GMP-binding regulatory protein BcsB n=1 Tax=Microvirga sp. 2YAF29 TaxID=3233031 RepID=UPI003F945367